MSPRVRRLSVVMDPGGVWAELRGWHAYDLIVDVGGRPQWARTAKAWSTSGKRARDAIALAESRGYIVEIREVAS